MELLSFVIVNYLFLFFSMGLQLRIFIKKQGLI